MTAPREFLAVWTWKLPNGLRQEVTLTLWAPDIHRAGDIADTWFERACPDIDAHRSIADLANERIPL